MIRYLIFVIICILFNGSLYAATVDEDKDIAAGSVIFNTNCSNICHQAPAARRLKPTQWRVVLNTMQIRMQSIGMPQLTEQQFNQLYAFLKAGR